MTKVLIMTLAPMVLVTAIQILGPQFAKEHELRKTRNALLAENDDLSKKTVELKEKIERFDSEPAFVERTAHEIGMLKDDEVVFKFE